MGKCGRCGKDVQTLRQHGNSSMARKNPDLLILLCENCSHQWSKIYWEKVSIESESELISKAWIREFRIFIGSLDLSKVS